MISRLTITVMICLMLPTFCLADDIASGALAEMASKKSKTFDVAGARFRGPTSFKISYPQSWGTSPMSQQGVVGRIASTNGQGMDSLVIVVSRVDPTIKDPTPDNVFRPEFFSKTKLPGSSLIRAERYKEGKFDGGVMEYYLEQSRPPAKLRTHVTNYLFIQNGALIQLQFYVLLGEKEDKAVDDPRIAAFKPVWKAVLATLTLGQSSPATRPSSQPRN